MNYTLDPITIFKHASFVVKIVMLILTAMSIATVAVIVFKVIEYALATFRSEEFLEDLDEESDLRVIQRRWKGKTRIPQVFLFSSIYKRILKELQRTPSLSKERFEEIASDSLRELKDRLSRFLIFLATTASAAPFIGLFGTVWGIMDAFFRIGHMKSVGLPVVAPAIAEALIATAMGLMAAIPAAIGYNYLLNWQKRISFKSQAVIEKIERRLPAFIKQMNQEFKYESVGE